jgi:hypothetical protein
MIKYNKKELEIIVKKSYSVADVCRELKIRPVGGNYKTLKKYFNIFEIDISHFTGQGWNSGENYTHFGKVCKLEDILIKNSTYTNTNNIKNKLFDSGIKENKCEECGLTEWNGKKISLHLDHINGDNLDHRIENIRILCPNCHSQTETYCKSKHKCSSSELRKKKYDNKKNENKYCKCGKEISKHSKNCDQCDNLNKRKVKNRPTIETLLYELSESNYTAIGKKYGVSDNCIRKWIKIK